MTMTERDYELVAEVIRTTKELLSKSILAEQGPRYCFDLLEVLLATSLKKSDPSFDTSKFYEACREKEYVHD